MLMCKQCWACSISRSLLYFSEIKTYNTSVDSTLPKVDKKRKFSDEINGDAEVISAKVPKVEVEEGMH